VSRRHGGGATFTTGTTNTTLARVVHSGGPFSVTVATSWHDAFVEHAGPDVHGIEPKLALGAGS
jgi:hypothetical protein